MLKWREWFEQHKDSINGTADAVRQAWTASGELHLDMVDRAMGVIDQALCRLYGPAWSLQGGRIDDPLVRSHRELLFARQRIREDQKEDQ